MFIHNSNKLDLKLKRNLPTSNESGFNWKVISPVELLVEYPDGEFYRLTNEKECHNNFQYKTGINTDILPFNPSGECSPEVCYFFPYYSITYVRILL